MSAQYENIPPERRDEFLKNAEAEAREAEARHLGQEVVAEAMMITEQDNLYGHFMETMAAAKSGIPGLAMAGRATAADLAWEANRRVAKGANPTEVLEELHKAVKLGAKGSLIQRGFMGGQDVADYGNELLASGMDPELAQTLITRAQIPKSPPSKPIF